MSRARLGAPPCSGPGQRADGRHDGGTEIGAGRRHHAGGERRRVEPVVDRQDHVLLNGPGVQRARLGAGQHVQVVGGEAEVVARLEGLLALPQAVRRRQNRRHDRAEPEGLVVELVGTDVVGRAPAELGRQERDGGAQHVERCAAAGRRPAARCASPGGRARRRRTSSPKAAAAAASGSSPWNRRCQTSSRERFSASSTAEYCR